MNNSNFTNEISGAFIMIPKQLYKSNISANALKLMLYMYEKPSNWNFNQTAMSNEMKVSKSTITRIVKELKEKGFLKIEQDEFGNFNYTATLPTIEKQDDEETITLVDEDEAQVTTSEIDECVEDLRSEFKKHYNSIADRFKSKKIKEAIKNNKKDISEIKIGFSNYVEMCKQEQRTLKYVQNVDVFINQKRYIDFQDKSEAVAVTNENRTVKKTPQWVSEINNEQKEKKSIHNASNTDNSEQKRIEELKKNIAKYLD